MSRVRRGTRTIVYLVGGRDGRSSSRDHTVVTPSECATFGYPACLSEMNRWRIDSA